MIRARKLLKFLEERKENLSPLLILTHNFPDPDSLASAFALQYLAKNCYGINARIVYGGVIGRMENRAMVQTLKIPIYKLSPKDLKKYENVALVDTQPAFHNNPFHQARKATLVIDTHPSLKKPLADFCLIETECGATSSILAKALLLTKVKIPMHLATALAYGIQTDTMNLYRVKSREVIDIYMNLLPYCDMKALAHIQNPVRSRGFFRTLGRGIQNASTRRGLVITHLGEVENPDLVAQIADFFLAYKQMNKSFCTGRYKDKLYVSLRLDRAITDAGDMLRDLFENKGNAGGHDAIAGGSLKVGPKATEEDWQTAEDNLTSKLLKRLRIPLKGEPYFPFRASPAN